MRITERSISINNYICSCTFLFDNVQKMKKYFLDIIASIICTILFLVYSLIDYINNYLIFLPNIPEAYFSEKKRKKKLRRFYKNKHGNR